MLPRLILFIGQKNIDKHKYTYYIIYMHIVLYISNNNFKL